MAEIGVTHQIELSHGRVLLDHAGEEHEGRRSDARLFNFYSKLAEGALWAGLSLKEQIDLARKEFGKPQENHVPLFQLTVSHKHRMSVIRAVQKVELQQARAAGKQCMWLPPIYSSMQIRTQGLWMLEGKLLISVQTATSVYNN